MVHRAPDQGREDWAILGQVEGDLDGVFRGEKLESRTVVPAVLPGQLVHSLLLLPAASRDPAVDDLHHEGPHGCGLGRSVNVRSQEL